MQNSARERLGSPPHEDPMPARPAALGSRLLRPARPAPAAAGLKPALLLSLQAFEAAVRLGSFKAAATALHLSPSAVSHRIRNLERALGDRLFTRAHRVVRPTRAGVALAATTGRAFADLLRATAPAQSASGQRRLRLAVAPPFASLWLVPRIGGFMAAHPDIELAIENVSRSVDLETEPFDAAIRVGDGNFPALTAIHLMDIGTVPVATKALARRLRLRQPADLAAATLIHVSTFPLAWPVWLGGAGIGGMKARQAMWVDSFGAALEAAEQGVGVALGLDPLFRERERAGAVCRPIAVTYATGSLWLVHPPADRGNPILRSFKRWLLAELAGDR
jgi:DNA-binding transcriptional LysR family regulator